MDDSFHTRSIHNNLEMKDHTSFEFHKRIEFNRNVLDNMASNGLVLLIPIRFVVFDGSDFTDTVSPSDSEIYEEVDYVNEVYANSGFNVRILTISIHEYEDDTYYENYSGRDDDTQLFIDYGDPNLINVFYIPGAGQHASLPISIESSNMP